MSHTPSIVLISLQNTFIDFGIRYISSSCVQAGLDVQILWITREPGDPVGEKQIDDVIAWLQTHPVDLVGISVMSVHFSRAAMITKAVQSRMKIPVVWGGVHPITDPEECLDIADFVCPGDGEISIRVLAERLINKETLTGIENIWFKENGTIRKSRRKLIQDIESLPPPDYDLGHQWYLDPDDGVIPLTKSILKNGIPWKLGRHHLISSRGCPFKCSYCYNTALFRIFGDDHCLRIRSVDNLMMEINAIVKAYPFLDVISIMDDSFLFKPRGWIEEFCRQFKKTGKKFGLLVHPKTLNPERIEMLIDAGLIGFQMGLQSGSERISRGLYNRSESVEEFIKTANMLDAYMDRLQARTYDVIVDNPYETDEDQEATIRVLASLKKPFHIQVFSLTLYPDTDLYRKMKADNMTPPEDMLPENKEYLKFKPTLLNRLIWLTHCTPEKVILFFLEHRDRLWGRILFTAYYYGWEKSLRLMLRKTKHTLLAAVSAVAGGNRETATTHQ
jgi:radical SAM superfamily enzyme YgiQ (UPF0313 family)